VLQSEVSTPQLKIHRSKNSFQSTLPIPFYRPLLTIRCQQFINYIQHTIVQSTIHILKATVLSYCKVHSPHSPFHSKKISWCKISPPQSIIVQSQGPNFLLWWAWYLPSIVQTFHIPQSTVPDSPVQESYSSTLNTAHYNVNVRLFLRRKSVTSGGECRMKVWIT